MAAGSAEARTRCAGRWRACVRPGCCSRRSTVLGRRAADDAFTYAELRANLLDKLEHPDFRADLSTLVVHLPSGYDLVAAADVVIERLGHHLRNAPPHDELRDGRWRAGHRAEPS